MEMTQLKSKLTTHHVNNYNRDFFYTSCYFCGIVVKLNKCLHNVEPPAGSVVIKLH